MEEMLVLLRLFQGQEFQVERFWAITKLQNILLAKQLGANAEFFKEQKERLLQVAIFNSEGRLMEVTQGAPSGNSASGSTAEVFMEGMMTLQDTMCAPGIQSYDRTMRSLYSNSGIEGIISRVDSGGGQADAGSHMLNTQLDRNKPVVTHTTFMASAALKGSLASDRIIADSKGTTVGSIGTMFQISKELLQRSTDDDLTIYSKKSPNKNRVIEELKRGNVEPIIEKVTRADEMFMAEVEKHRNLKGDAEAIKHTLSGETFDGTQAKRRGLIDQIGSIAKARQVLKQEIRFAK